MSRIYFHSENGDAELSGRERHMMGRLCEKALLYSLGDLDRRANEEPWIMKHIPSDNYLHQNYSYSGNLIKSIETWLMVGSMTSGENAYLTLDGEKHELFTLQLNSAAMMGGDAMKLAARLHGQCEIHCYVEGKNRNWLAGIMEDGLSKCIFRTHEGWDDVIKLLRSRGDGPVVCSYSVSEQFPNSPKNSEDDKWYNLSFKERWECAIKRLRKSKDGLELKPRGWKDFYFGNGKSGFNFSNKRN